MTGFGYILWCESNDPAWLVRQEVGRHVDAGGAHLAVAYPGEDHDGFFEFWSNQLRPAL